MMRKEILKNCLRKSLWLGQEEEEKKEEFRDHWLLEAKWLKAPDILKIIWLQKITKCL